MSGNCFVDTNILLYSRDASEARKQSVAHSVLEELWQNRSGRVSVQVLNEYFVNATRKLDPGLTPQEAWDDIEALRVWKPLQLDMTLMQRGYAVCQQYKISWWDSLIIAAAEATGSSVIFSEDLSDTQLYLGMEVINPFLDKG